MNRHPPERAAFVALSPTEQQQAVVRLAAEGLKPQTIAAATGLALEVVRTVLGPSPCDQP